MPNPEGVNVLHSVGAAFITVGLVLHIVGLDLMKHLGISDAFKSARAFAILGMFSGLWALGLTYIYLIKLLKQNVNSNLLKKFVLCTSILTIVFIVICISCFVAGFQEKLEGYFNQDLKAGYSIFLSGFGCAAITLGGILFYVSGRTSGETYARI
uniref:Uncharacterized protein n=1 Tax=Biomphalaria glabrata TaxID=6526 RepID=A0A2C9M0L9_BIOGL